MEEFPNTRKARAVDERSVACTVSRNRERRLSDDSHARREARDEAEAPREQRYYMRVTRVAATICWGIAVCGAAMIPTSVALDAAQKRTTPAALPYAQVWSTSIPS